MRTTRSLPKGTKLVSRHRQVFDSPVLQFASTVGKTRTRIIPKIGEVQDFMSVIGAGRYALPIPATRRI